MFIFQILQTKDFPLCWSLKYCDCGLFYCWTDGLVMLMSVLQTDLWNLCSRKSATTTRMHCETSKRSGGDGGWRTARWMVFSFGSSVLETGNNMASCWLVKNRTFPFIITHNNSGVQTSSCLADASPRCRHWSPVRAEVIAERSTDRKWSLSSPLSVAQTQERQGPSRTKAWLTSTEKELPVTFNHHTLKTVHIQYLLYFFRR